MGECDKTLLKAIFNPWLSDRRAEGDHFAPPDASYSHVEKLRALIRGEEAVRNRRRDVFFCKDFSINAPGRLFPESWTSVFKIENGQSQIAVAEGRPISALTERSEYQNKHAS